MESLSRISSLVETARDLTLEAARDAAAARRSSTRAITPQALKKLLDSRRDAEVLDGLRRVISMFYSNQPVLSYFTAVVKNIASPNMEIKKLVYAFLIQHAEAAPDTALLSINTIQKSLSDSNPPTRALALRTMSSIRVPVISQIVALGIKRGTADMSPVVRKTAALAIPKCYSLDTSHAPLLEDQLAILLGDKQYYVVGAAVYAFLQVCPERLDLIHPHWRSLVKKLVDMDEWGQLATLELLLTYSRQCFSRKTRGQETDQEHVLQQDLALFLNSIQPLLQSRNSAVVLAVSRCYLYLGTKDQIQRLAGPLLSTLRTAPDISSLAMATIAEVVRRHPVSFLPSFSSFLLRASDPVATAESKLKILSLLFPLAAAPIQSLILTDLSHHTKAASSPGLVRASVLAIGRCASTAPSQALRSRCLQLLLGQLSSPDATLVAASLDEIRVLIQRDPSAHANTVVRLAKHLDVLKAPRARAAIVWLVSEYAAGPETAQVAADVWRILLRNFANEAVAVQSQILLLAGRVYLHHHYAKDPITPATLEEPASKTEGTEDRISKMLHHTFILARYAHSFMLRDRARFLKALLLEAPTIDLAKLLLLSAKRSVSETERSQNDNHIKTPVGTAAWLLNIDIRGMIEVPPWTTKDMGSAERSVGKDVSAKPSLGLLSKGLTAASGSRTPDTNLDVRNSNGIEKTSKTLDQWLDEEDAEPSEESEEEVESEETATDEDSEDDSEDDSEESTDGEEEDTDDDSNDKGPLLQN